MDFRRALNEIVKGKNIDLRHDNADKAILVAFSALSRSNADMLQLQELKNILSTGVMLAKVLVTAYDESIASRDVSFKAVAEAIERIADELEKNNISCFLVTHHVPYSVTRNNQFRIIPSFDAFDVWFTRYCWR